MIWRSDGEDKIISREKGKQRIMVVLVRTIELILGDCQKQN